MSESGRECQRSQHVVALEILIIEQDALGCCASGQELEDDLDRIAKPSDTRLSVADLRIDRDAIQ
jgi:hypothetical protein